MAINFPSSPSLNDTYTTGGVTYTWDGATWKSTSSFSETDPIFTASAASGIISSQITNWDTAYGWGNHANAGYLTSFTETDPIFNASAASTITGTQVTNWDTAYGWGDHSAAGYLTSFTEADTLATVTTRGSTTTNSITVGQLTAGGLTYPTNNGTNGQVLTSDGVGNVTWAPSGSSLQSRTTAFVTTSSIADGASANVTIVAAKTYALQKIQTSAAAWVTLYTDTTSRTNDASRSEATDPISGSGVIAEVITSGATTQKITPGTIGWNDDITPSSNVYLKVVNKSGSTQTITVTLHYVQLEA